MKKLLFLITIAFFAMVGCTKDVELIPVSSVFLNKTVLTMKVGQSELLNATVNPGNASDQQLTWSSSNSQVAIVDQNGRITALSEGTTIITACSSNNKRADCTVTVAPEAPEIIPVSSIMLDRGSETIEIGGVIVLTATVYPENATNKSVFWSTSNASIATVQNGIVTAIGAGTAVISATTVDGNKSVTCIIKVEEKNIDIENLTLDKELLNLKAGESAALTATVTPANATSKELIWSSSSPAIAAVSSNGIVTAISEGTAVITVTTAKGEKSKYCIVNVTAAEVGAVQITLDRANIEMDKDGVEVLKATILPANSKYNEVTWLSTNPAVATVTSGIVTAISAGTTVIVASVANTSLSAFCIVTVKEKIISVTGITLNCQEMEIKETESKVLTATITPDDATNRNIIWSSVNPGVAIVTNGVVTGVSEGHTVITATTEDGGRSAFCQVTVTKNIVYVTSVKLSESEIILDKGETKVLTATVNPSDATNPQVIWNSSNNAIATVDNGIVKAIGVGQAVITVKTVDGEKTDFCIVTVEDNGGNPGGESDVYDGEIEDWGNGEDYDI